MITSLLFFPDKEISERPEDHSLSAEAVFPMTVDGVRLHGLYFSVPKSKGVVLFLHGNAGNISGRIYKAKGWVERGYSVLLLDYRGYGQSSGGIQQGEDLVRDAEAGLNWLVSQGKWKREQVIFYGESLGSHPAIRMACSGGKALILEAPFTAFTDLASIHYPALPRLITDALLKDFRFDNLNLIAQVKAPVFLMHGKDDATCPYSMGQKLFEKAPEPKKMLSVTYAGHNNLPECLGAQFWDEPVNFLQEPN